MHVVDTPPHIEPLGKKNSHSRYPPQYSIWGTDDIAELSLLTIQINIWV